MTDDKGLEKVKQFRRFPKEVKVSDQKNEVVVLTSDRVIRLDTNELSLIEADHQVDYENLEVTPNGTFIFSTFSNIYKMKNSLSDMQIVKSP